MCSCYKKHKPVPSHERAYGQVCGQHGEALLAIKNTFSVKTFRNGKFITSFADGRHNENLNNLTELDWFTMEGYQMFIGSQHTTGWAQQSEVSLQEALETLQPELDKIEGINADLNDTEREDYWWQIVMTHTATLKICVRKEKPRKQRSKKGYMRMGDMKTTLQSIPENRELFFE